MQARNGVRHVVGCCHLSGLFEQHLGCGPVWEFADRNQIINACSRHDEYIWFFQPVSPTVVPYPPSTAYVSDDLWPWPGLRHGCSRSLVIFLPRQQRPGRTRHLVGERDRTTKHNRARRNPAKFRLPPQDRTVDMTIRQFGRRCFRPRRLDSKEPSGRGVRCKLTRELAHEALDLSPARLARQSGLHSVSGS